MGLRPTLPPGPLQSGLAAGWLRVSGEHGPCGGLRLSTPSVTSEKAHAPVLIFPVPACCCPHRGRATRRRPVCPAVDHAAGGADGRPGPASPSRSPSQPAIDSGGRGLCGAGRCALLCRDRSLGGDPPPGRWHVWPPPHGATIRRVLMAVDRAAVERALTRGVLTRRDAVQPPGAVRRSPDNLPSFAQLRPAFMQLR